jgi:hypothetical protein
MRETEQKIVILYGDLEQGDLAAGISSTQGIELLQHGQVVSVFVYGHKVQNWAYLSLKK